MSTTNAGSTFICRPLPKFNQALVLPDLRHSPLLPYVAPNGELGPASPSHHFTSLPITVLSRGHFPLCNDIKGSQLHLQHNQMLNLVPLHLQSHLGGAGGPALLTSCSQRDSDFNIPDEQLLYILLKACLDRATGKVMHPALFRKKAPRTLKSNWKALGDQGKKKISSKKARKKPEAWQCVSALVWEDLKKGHFEENEETVSESILWNGSNGRETVKGRLQARHC